MATESDVRVPSADRRDRPPPVVGRRPGTTDTARPAGRVGVETPERVAAVRASRLLEHDGDGGDGMDDTFDRVARLAALLLGAPTAFVTVVDDQVSVIRGWAGPAGHPGSRPRRLAARDAACQLVVDTGTAVVVPDVREDERTRDLPGVAMVAARSWIGLPFTDAAGFVLGDLCVVDGVVRKWTDEEVAGLRDLATVLERTVRLRGIATTLRTYADQAEELAVTLQQVLLPAWIPRVAGIEIATRFRPGGTGAEVLGDFYDVLLHDDGFSVVIGDVAGRGPEAARTASLARSAVRTAASADQDPVSVLSTVHHVLRHDDAGPRRFVTVAYASFERGGPTADGSVRWDVVVCSAGHPPGFVIGADGAVTAIRAGGRALGVTAEPAIDGDAFPLGAGDSLVLYTDGLTGDHGSLGAQLEEDGAQHALAVATDDAEQLADGLIAASRRHTGRRGDDLAVVVIGVR